MKLYGSALSPYVARVLLAIRWKGLSIPLAEPPGGSIKSPEYLAINPLGKMPALDTPGGVVIESEVILEFLEETHPQPSLLPGSANDRSHIRAIGRTVDLYVMPALLGLLGQMNPATRNDTAVAEKRAELRKGLDGLEKLLIGPWTADGQATLADCSLVPANFYLERFLPAFGQLNAFADHPKLASVWAVQKADPAVGQLMAEMSRALEDFMKRRAANA